jgi:hypothetical protein
MDEVYIKALQSARKELESLREERTVLDQRIAKLARTIEGLASLEANATLSSDIKGKVLELEISEATGFTSAIRQIISMSVFGVTATEIRDALVEDGFDPEKYSSMLTVIHNTLQRLERQGEIQRGISFFTGKRVWMLKGKELQPPPQYKDAK